MPRTTAIALLALLLLVLAAPAAPAPDGDKDYAASVLLPAGIADAAGKTGFVTNDKGGIDVLDLATGELLWSTKDANKPLAVMGRKLLAQAPVMGKGNQVRVVVLDVAQKGKKLLESDPVAFPDWVSVGLAHGRSFTSSGRVHKGDLLLKWEARAWYAGGAAPTPEIQKRARKHAAGVARVNLENGKVEMLPADKAPGEGTVKLPKELEKLASQQYWRTGADWKTTPFLNGKVVSALAVEQQGQQQTMRLKRWDRETGKPLETVELLKGKSLWPQLSADGKFVCIHQALVKEQLPEGDYAWWVFSLETGKQVAKFPYEAGTQGMTVIGPRAYYMVTAPRKGGLFRPGAWEQPRVLKAVDLKTGKVAWEHAVEPQRMLPPLP